MSRLRYGLALPLGLFLGAFFYGCSSSPKHGDPPALTKAEKSRPKAPEFALKDADGKVVRLSDYRGKVVLLDFWATWCGPCKMEIPWFMQFERQNKNKGFAVIGVSMDDDGWNAVKPFMQQVGMNYRVVLGDDTTAQMYGGVDALPTTFLIDRQGRIAAVHQGLASKQDFEDGIQELLRAPASGDSRAALPGFFIRSN